MTAVSRLPKEERRDAAAAGYDIGVLLPPDFTLENGERLSSPEMALRIHGDYALPKIIVAGGISAGRAVADHEREKGWWRAVVSHGGAIDLRRYCIIGFDFLPNAGETARTISTSDQARALAYALDAIKVATLHAFVGASYGGMVALAFAEEYPFRLDRLCVISAADRPHPAATAIRGVQRRIVEFARRSGAAEEGVSLARQLAMIAYRTPEEFAARFAHAPGAAAGDPHDVCRYLISRGEAYRVPAERYVTLSDSIDRHAIDPRKVKAPSMFLASLSDRLVPPEDIERLSEQVARGAYFAFNSLYGHDAFLKEEATFGPVIKSFIEESLS
jgi:homoserine O-acetyltransferase